MKDKLNRRDFVRTTSVVGAGLAFGLPHIARGAGSETAKPALLGGPKAQTGGFPGWPVFDQTEERRCSTRCTAANGTRQQKMVANFGHAYAKLTGAKHCLATSCGTSALYTALRRVGLGPGDEVIIPPYTFVATYNVVVLNYALPVFVDSDIETFQIDANKIEAAITKQNKAIMPVHLGGSAADLDKILGSPTNIKSP